MRQTEVQYQCLVVVQIWPLSNDADIAANTPAEISVDWHLDAALESTHNMRLRR